MKHVKAREDSHTCYSKTMFRWTLLLHQHSRVFQRTLIDNINLELCRVLMFKDFKVRFLFFEGILHRKNMPRKHISVFPFLHLETSRVLFY